MQQQILVDITEHDIELFQDLVNSNNQSDTLVWTFPSETSGDTIEITFRQEQSNDI